METILKLAAKYLGKLSFSDIDTIVTWVIKAANTNLEGWQKADEVASKFNSKWADRAKWVVETVVQLAYAIAKIRKLDV